MEGSVSSLVRGLQVLECFSQRRNSYTLTELAKRLSMPKSSLHRVLKTLSQMNYLRYEGITRRYYLGIGVLSLGFSVLQSMELREIARPYLEKFSRECNKTINLAILDKKEMVIVERIRVPGIRSFDISVGKRLPPWNTAVGRAVLAYLEPVKVQEIVNGTTGLTDCNLSKDEFLQLLADIRKDGFAVDNQEYLKGIIAIGVPIFSATDVSGSINMIFEPEDVCIEELRNKYAPKLMELGKKLSEALGHRG
jgi:DNA-binding IclR family transcriptional regulator